MAEALQFSVQGIAAGSLYAIVALGLVLLYRSTRVLNFAHGELGALGAYVFWSLHPGAVPLPLALAAGVGTSAAAGLATERIVARPLAGASRLQVAVATLALAELLRAVIVAGFGPEATSVPLLVTSPVLVVGRVVLPAQRLLILATAAALAGGLTVFLRRSAFGLAVRAAAEDLTAVRLRGIAPAAVTRFAWGASAALSGVAAILVAPLLGLNPAFMTAVLVRAFAAALVGGITSLAGALVGGIVIGVVEANLQRVTSYPGAVEALLFVIMLAVLLLRPQGLLGSREVPADAHHPAPPRRRSRRVALALPSARARTAVAVVAGAALIALATTWGEHQYFRAATAVVYATAGVAIYLLSGLAGQLSLGHAGFLGVGAFAAGLLTTRAGLPLAAAVPIAGVVGAAVATVVGLPSFRIRGLYLAISTLGFGIACERYLFRLNVVSGGSAGLQLPAIPARDLLLYGVALLAVAVLLAHRVTRSKAGRALAVVRADEVLAESWGIPARRYKLAAFALSGLLAASAGVLYGTLIGQVTSELFSLNVSITLVAMAIVGGLGSIGGVVAGSVLFALLPELLSGWSVGFAHGAILLAVVIFFPKGLSRLWATAG